MIKYISFFKVKFTTELQYRAAAISGMLTQLFFGFIFIFILEAFYKSSNNQINFAFSNSVSLIWFGQIFYNLISLYRSDRDILESIVNGNISYELCRPIDIYYLFFVKSLANRLGSSFIKGIPLIFITLLLPKPYNLILPKSFINFILFLIFFVIGILLIVTIDLIKYGIIFKVIKPNPVNAIFNFISEIFSGTLIPIALMPIFLQKISYKLPFAYMLDFPYKIYSGEILMKEILMGFFIQIFWLLILFSLGKFIFRKFERLSFIQGG